MEKQTVFLKRKITDKKEINPMVILEYFNGKEWVFVSRWVAEHLAWISLGGDDYNYRTKDVTGNILTDKSTLTHNITN
jgi:expansin (peptidoglycan-binding protein)